MLFRSNAELVQEDYVTSADVEQASLVGTRAPHGLRLQLERWASATNVKLNFSVEADAPSVLVRLASMGECYSIVAVAALENEIKLGALATAEIAEPSCERIACLCASKRVPTDASKDAVLSLMKNLMNDLVEHGKWRGGRAVVS